MRTPFTAWSRQLRRNASARSRFVSSTRSTPSSFGMPLKNLCSALCATEPRNFGSTSASIVRGSSSRSTNQADEQSEKRSSSVTLKLVRSPRYSSTSGWRSSVGRRNACNARSRRRSQPFASASTARLRLVVRCERRQRAQPLALGRCRFERPRQSRERPSRRRVAHVLGREEPRYFIPERARFARNALVARRLAHEV